MDSSNTYVLARSSTLFQIPSAVQSRLPRLPSFCRTVPRHGLSAIRKARSLATSSPSTSGSSTPADEDYSDALSAGSFERDETPGISCAEKLHWRSNSATSFSGQTCDKSGVDWKFANQGHNLLRQATDEALTMDPRGSSPTYTRQLYLHGVTFLLRGLPADLTMDEQLSIRASLPTGVGEPMQLLMPQVGESQPLAAAATAQHSILHRALSTAIVQGFIVAQCILPYVVHVSTVMYQYDRDHKVVQRVTAQGIDTIDRLGRTGLAVGGRVLAMGEGKAAQLVGVAAKWVIDGVAGGIQDGVGEVVMLSSPDRLPKP